MESFDTEGLSLLAMSEMANEYGYDATNEWTLLTHDVTNHRETSAFGRTLLICVRIAPGVSA